MTMIDPLTGLPTPVKYTPVGAGQARAFGGLVEAAGTPLFSGSAASPAAPVVRPLGSLFTGSAGAGGLPQVNGASSLASLNRLRPVNGLASQVPQGAGANALSAANALRPAAASSGGGASGLVSQLSNAARGTGGIGGVRGTMAAARSTLPGILGKGGIAGSLARGAPAFAADLAASSLFGEGDEGFGEQAGRGFLRGAGWGAVAAPAVAAIPGVNLVGVPLVAAAAGITGTIGAALDVLDAGKWFGGGGGDDTPAVDPDDVLANVLDTAALDDVTNAQIMDSYAIQMQMASTIEDKEARAQAEAAALTSAATMALEALQTRDQATSAASNTLALQSQAGEIFEPLAQDIQMGAGLYAEAMGGLRDRLPESYQGIADATVARELSSADRLANAYRAQAAITPVVNQLTQYQQDYNNYAAQMFSQSLAQQAAGGAGSLGPSAQDVQAALLAGV